MTLAPELVDRFRRDLAALWPQVSDSSARLGLAVSGGGDSMALLALAHAIMPDRIAVATVDHGLRPESADEAALVAQTCRSFGIPHDTLVVTLKPGNVQDRARAARYAALADWCRDRSLWALATAHQLDDQAETLVMRLNRGSGLSGLAGVRGRGVVRHSSLLVLRPLLAWRRSELAHVVASANLQPAQDASNEDPRFERVRMRKALAAADWLDPLGLARSAALLGEAENYVMERLDDAFAAWVTLTPGEARLTPGKSDFEALELAGRIIARFGGTAARGDLAALVARLRRGENASLGGVLARVRGAEWVFTPEPPRSV